MDKLVFIKELKSGTTKNGKNYPIIYDQDNDTWNIWNQTCPLEINHAYLFTFHLNDANFKDIDKITPLVNIFKAQALKEVANRNDVIRNYSISITQAIQCYAISDKMPTNDELFRLATAIYTQIDNFADSKIPKTE